MITRDWLTEKRLRAHGTILALCLWSLFIWNLSTPGLRDRAGNLKGTDFLHLYTLGSVALAHDGAALYDMNVQARLSAARVPQAAGTLYLPLYPPQVSILFAPLARLTYSWALGVWWAYCFAIYGACSFLIWRACSALTAHGVTVALLAIAYPAFFHLIAWGQTSALALACFTGMFFLLRAERDFAAGLVLGCLIFKPQLGLAAAIVFLCAGAWKILFGAVVSSGIQLCIGAFYYGWAPFREWLAMLWSSRRMLPFLEPRPYQTHSLRTFWSMLVPWPAPALVLYGVSTAAALFFAITIWKAKSSLPLSFRYSALLLGTVLVAPHLTVYDLIILAPAILLLSDWLHSSEHLRAHRIMGTMIYLVYALPLVGPLARITHVQFSVIAMSWLMYLMWKTSKSGEEPAEPLVAHE